MKKILDACCGGRQCWFDKNHEDAVFIDNRKFYEVLTNGQTYRVDPDIVMDFRKMTFPDKSFSLVVFDPPHLFPGPNSWLRKKYGGLNRKTWKADLSQGFSECFRVLVDGGVLVFKWNEGKIPIKDVLELSPFRPLFGHTSGRQAKTIWVVFMKCDASKKE